MLMILRRVAWCKAKGELLSILEYYVNEKPEEANFLIMNQKITEFIKWIEEESPIA